MAYPATIGPYKIVRQIGEGGMGVVFEARDDRLDRSVAIKILRATGDGSGYDRFKREARAAAAISHPNVCQVFDIGEHDGEPFIAMELLDGASLADRLLQGPLPTADIVRIGGSVLAALGELHRRNIIHRDLKPSNIFLTSHGVKLLDFGLARGLATGLAETSVTMPGIVVGTPQYMAPEQARGLTVDARSDIFAMGAVLFEMLNGRPAFQGQSAVEVLHAVIHDNPFGSGSTHSGRDVERVARRALEKSPANRYESAEAMSVELVACLPQSSSAAPPAAVPVTRRLIVLPFRMLRPDPESEFLAYSLPDAITVSLSGLDSLLVRSSFVAARFGDAVPDFRVVATEADVDAIVMGTLLRAGTQLRIAVQLVEAPSGTLLWSHSTQVPMEELFEVQDRVSAAVVEALSLPVSARESRLLRRDVPANPDAYASYLRANRLVESFTQWAVARELYQEAVTADPAYAPAWARYARCLRLLGKYGEGPEAEEFDRQAETAFQRAFQLNPDLSLAHNLYTYAEVETKRAPQAMVRLLRRLQQRSNDPELFGGLVHACRYCGLLEASLSADRLAKRLDPAIRTSAKHTYFLNGDFDRAIALDSEDPPFVTMISQICQGRHDLAAETFDSTERRLKGNPHLANVLVALRAIIDRRADVGRATIAQLLTHRAFRDPEGWFYWSLGLAGFGADDEALSLLSQAVDGGLYCPRALEVNPVLAALRPTPAFQAILERARVGHEEARREFVSAGGPRLLGPATAESPRL
jgi:serine/threonine protein kinase/tetratricopeptide (TPR) repeat protein